MTREHAARNAQSPDSDSRLLRAELGEPVFEDATLVVWRLRD
jgi:hypothetical protein